MKDYQKHFSPKQTPQSQPVPGKKMVRNHAGGYVFEADKWQKALRFLIQGSEGTYYVGEHEMTVKNCENLVTCLKEDGIKLVDLIVAVSEQARAPRQGPALFALSICLSPDLAERDTRVYAASQFSRVVRTPTHLFTMAEYRKAFGGWGKLFQGVMKEYYTKIPAERLAYHMLKYRQRNGWSHADILRMARPKPPTSDHEALYQWALGLEKEHKNAALFEQIHAAEYITSERPTPGKTAEIIWREGLTREMIPTEYLKEPVIWEALLERMPMTALVRSIRSMTKQGALPPMSSIGKYVANKLTNKVYWGQDWASVPFKPPHPLLILNALRAYEEEAGTQYNSRVRTALEDAFYLSFGSLRPTGKKRLIALDSSGSMTAPFASGKDRKGRTRFGSMSCREAAVALAMVAVHQESEVVVLAFTDRLSYAKVLPLSRQDSLTAAMDKLRRLVSARGTDCSIPFSWASRNRMVVDSIEVYTDNQTWAGTENHPFQAAEQYRRNVPGMKWTNVTMAPGWFSLQEVSNDQSWLLPVVGFDTSVPTMISEFLNPLTLEE